VQVRVRVEIPVPLSLPFQGSRVKKTHISNIFTEEGVFFQLNLKMVLARVSNRITQVVYVLSYQMGHQLDVLHSYLALEQLKIEHT